MNAMGNHLWQSTLFAGAVALLALALRNNRAQMRYRLWLIASLKFLIPFSLLVAIGGYFTLPVPVPLGHEPLPAAVRQIAVPEVFSSVSISDVPTAASPFPAILFAIWLCGVAVVLFSWARRWMRVRVMVRASTPLFLETSIPVLSAPSLVEPGVFGIFRPVLLLPAGITGHLTSSHLEAILAHELCHVRRRDNLAAAVHMLVEAVFWFHPLVWWIGSRMVEERENACDEEVLRLGNQPTIYAESILKTCQFYLESPLTCVSGVTGSDLKKRITRIMTESLVANLNFRKKLMLAVAGVAAVALPLAIGLAQSSPLPTFEVASIRLSKPETHGSHWHGTRGRLTGTGVRLREFIETAYGVRAYQILGPDWLGSQGYDIAAEYPGSTPESQFPLMLQSMLKDRFKLAFHREEKVLPIYKLTVAKNGLKLQAAKDTGRHGSDSSRGHWNGQQLSMAAIAEHLSRSVDRPVLDKTGLSGVFNFDVQWAPDDNPARSMEQATEAGASDAGPSIFTALQQYLGLKLVPGKGPIELLVIDHVERTPTEN